MSVRLLLALPVLLASVDSASAQVTLIDQPPTGSSLWFSDIPCWECHGGGQILAEDFVVATTRWVRIDAITIWGGYVPSNQAIPDDFTLRIYANDAVDLPGELLYEEEPALASRVDAGFDLGPYDAYEYTFVPAGLLELGPGEYWVEIYDTTTDHRVSFGWVDTVDPDVNGGRPGGATRNTGVDWFVNSAELAIRVDATELDAPTLRVLGTCPGPVTVAIDHVTAFGEVAIFGSRTAGPYVVPGGGMCAGTELGVVDPIPWTVATADAQGSLALPVNLPASVCGAAFVQAVDLATCRTTNVLGL